MPSTPPNAASTRARQRERSSLPLEVVARVPTHRWCQVLIAGLALGGLAVACGSRTALLPGLAEGAEDGGGDYWLAEQSTVCSQALKGAWLLEYNAPVLAGPWTTTGFGSYTSHIFGVCGG
jgi:hypothetical protein